MVWDAASHDCDASLGLRDHPKEGERDFLSGNSPAMRIGGIGTDG